MLLCDERLQSTYFKILNNSNIVSLDGHGVLTDHPQIGEKTKATYNIKILIL